MPPVRTSLLLVLTAAAAATVLTGCAALRIDRAVHTSTGFTSQVLCSSAFVSGLAPDKVFADTVQPIPGMRLVNWGMSHRLDPAKREVTASVAGMFESRAVYRDGLGCMLVPAGEPVEPVALAPLPVVPVALPEIAGPAVVAPSDPRLQAALDRAFAEPAKPPFRRTRAVVVLRDGQVIAERYAAGFGVDTPVIGWSMTKSVVNAMVGILVRQGRLNIDQPAPVPEWRDPADPRHAITTDQLMRQTSGLDIDQTKSGFDRDSQLVYLERDKGGAAATAALAVAPGTRWNYSDGQYLLVSRIVRDTVGGKTDDVLQFAHRELFGPLGMRHVTLEFDTTGTPIGSNIMFASARDWARFGQLYLNDGMAGGRRILPAGWVARSTTASPGTGYGAGFFNNSLDGLVEAWGVPWGPMKAPAGTYFARGFQGQITVVVPSEKLVVVRLASSQVREDDTQTANQLVTDVLAALKTPF